MLDNEFVPTFLIVKRHSVTGLKYFCKTIRKNPYRYNGSGVEWKKHLKEHGREHVETIWCELFNDKDDLVEFAKFFSEEFNIVNSSDWANSIIEDGLTGFLSENSKNVQRKRVEDGSHHLLDGYIQKKYQDDRVTDGTHNWLSGEQQRDTQNNLLKTGKHRFCSSEYQSKVSSSGNLKRISDGSHNAIQIYTCPHCHKSGKGIAMFRHHFNNCRAKSC